MGLYSDRMLSITLLYLQEIKKKIVCILLIYNTGTPVYNHDYIQSVIYYTLIYAIASLS